MTRRKGFGSIRIVLIFRPSSVKMKSLKTLEASSATLLSSPLICDDLVMKLDFFCREETAIRMSPAKSLKTRPLLIQALAEVLSPRCVTIWFVKRLFHRAKAIKMMRSSRILICAFRQSQDVGNSFELMSSQLNCIATSSSQAPAPKLVDASV